MVIYCNLEDHGWWSSFPQYQRGFIGVWKLCMTFMFFAKMSLFRILTSAWSPETSPECLLKDDSAPVSEVAEVMVGVGGSPEQKHSLSAVTAYIHSPGGYTSLRMSQRSQWLYPAPPDWGSRLDCEPSSSSCVSELDQRFQNASLREREQTAVHAASAVTLLIMCSESSREFMWEKEGGGVGRRERPQGLAVLLTETEKSGAF